MLPKKSSFYVSSLIHNLALKSTPLNLYNLPTIRQNILLNFLKYQGKSLDFTGIEYIGPNFPLRKSYNSLFLKKTLFKKIYLNMTGHSLFKNTLYYNYFNEDSSILNFDTNTLIKNIVIKKYLNDKGNIICYSTNMLVKDKEQSKHPLLHLRTQEPRLSFYKKLKAKKRLQKKMQNSRIIPLARTNAKTRMLLKNYLYSNVYRKYLSYNSTLNQTKFQIVLEKTEKNKYHSLKQVIHTLILYFKNQLIKTQYTNLPLHVKRQHILRLKKNLAFLIQQKNVLLILGAKNVKLKNIYFYNRTLNLFYSKLEKYLNL